MDPFPPQRAGIHLYGAVPPGAYADFVHAAPPRREQGRVPAEQAVRGERPVELLGRVQHHLHHALHVPVGGDQACYVHTEAPGNGRSYLFGVKQFPFYLARLEHVERQGAQHGLRLQVKTQALHVANQASLPVADAPKPELNFVVAPGKRGPVRVLVDIPSHSPQICGKYSL